MSQYQGQETNMFHPIWQGGTEEKSLNFAYILNFSCKKHKINNPTFNLSY